MLYKYSIGEPVQRTLQDPPFSPRPKLCDSSFGHFCIYRVISVSLSFSSILRFDLTQKSKRRKYKWEEPRKKENPITFIVKADG